MNTWFIIIVILAAVGVIAFLVYRNRKSLPPTGSAHPKRDKVDDEMLNQVTGGVHHNRPQF